MTEELKSNLTNSFLTFIMEFGDPSSIDKKEIEHKCDCRIPELFNRQIYADRIKKKIGKEKFNHVIAAYLNKFNTKSGIDAVALKKELNLYGHLIERHLGKMAVKYLNLLTQVSLSIDDKPKGLLAS